MGARFCPILDRKGSFHRDMQATCVLLETLEVRLIAVGRPVLTAGSTHVELGRLVVAPNHFDLAVKQESRIVLDEFVQMKAFESACKVPCQLDGMLSLSGFEYSLRAYGLSVSEGSFAGVSV